MSSLLVLSATNVDQVIGAIDGEELVTLMAKVFSELNATSSDAILTKAVSIPHRATISTTNHTVLFMPSRIDAIGTAIKIVSVPSTSAPSDVKAHGLPGSTMVIDERTGDVIAVVNARKLTALRNAASSLLATRVMLRPDVKPRNIVAIGAGAQISAHLSLFLAAYPTVVSCKIFNRTVNDRLTAMIKDLRTHGHQTSIEGLPLPSGDDGNDHEFARAISAANIIVTATSSTSPLFPSKYVSPGTHLCLIGSYKPTMHEVDTELIRRAGKIVCDYKEGTVVEAGELISANVDHNDVFELGGLINMSSSSGWSLKTDLVEDIRASGDVTIFKSVGVGVQDVAIAHAVVAYAREHNIGTVIMDYDTV